MRTRERERFLRLNFTEKELEIRDKLYKGRNKAKYKIVITEENHKKSDSLDVFSDFPEEGRYIDTIYFYAPDQYLNVLKLYEGLFYQIFDLESGERIGYGMLDPDSPVEEIREFEGKTCGSVCEFCWWRGMLYDEKKNSKWYHCYNPIEKENEDDEEEDEEEDDEDCPYWDEGCPYLCVNCDGTKNYHRDECPLDWD